MKVGIVGTRDRNHAALWPIVNLVFDKLPKGAIVATGCNPHGVDHLVRELADGSHPLVVFHARWGTLGREAGPERNAMLVSYIDCLIAIPGPESRGTWNAVTLAKHAQKPIAVLNYLGRHNTVEESNACLRLVHELFHSTRQV